jgi:hypothetical protein
MNRIFFCKNDSFIRHIKNIKGRINFLLMERFSFLLGKYSGVGLKKIEFLSLIIQLISHVISDEKTIAFDPKIILRQVGQILEGNLIVRHCSLRKFKIGYLEEFKIKCKFEQKCK